MSDDRSGNGLAMAIAERISALSPSLRLAVTGPVAVFLVVASWVGGVLGLTALAVMFALVFLALGLAEAAVEAAERVLDDE